MKNLISLSAILIFGLCFCYAQNQGLSNWWLMGYTSSAGLPYGGTNIDFFSGAPNISYVTRPMDFAHTHTNISDTMGQILFYTNGYDIADSTDSIMQNGNNISPSGIKTVYPYGLYVPQACLVIPAPGSNHLYYLFHSTLDNAPIYNEAHFLYYSIIDMNLNNGKGAVTAKNVVLITDTLNMGKIIACKHGNGRDWWLVCMRANSNLIYKFLVTPYGISAPFMQNIGINRIRGYGQVKFTSDGNKFAYFFGNYTTTGDLEIFDFNRCNGDFSNTIHIVIPKSTGFGGGIEFAPNSNLLYVCNLDSVYQYDMTSSNIANSKIIIAAWDSFYSPNPPFATGFNNSELADDGKIYITTGNSTLHMHVINQPDSLGIACDLVQHGVQLPAFYFNTLPNHPNYFLGADSGSVCDTLTGVSIEKPPETILNVFPNPSNGIFTIHFTVHKNVGELEIYDVLGKLVRKEFVAQWSQYKYIDISLLPAGIYLCKMKWGTATSANVKVLKE